MERILIVDDETHVRQLLKEYLKSSGYQCELAANAAEARKQLDAKTFDLVITDIYMAGESGVDLAKYIKTVFIDTAIIIVSSMDDPDKIKKVLDIGVYGYIVKPIERNHVFINVENALQRLKLEKSERIYRNNLEHIIEERTAQVAENERRFRDLVEGSIQGIVVHLNKKAVFANKAFLDIFGYTEKELMQLDELHQIAVPEERGRLYDYQQARLAGKEAPSQYEFRGLRKDGTKIWVNNRVRVVDWHGKKAIQITVTDITQRKQSEAFLKKSELNLKAILASVLTGVLVIDAETHIIIDANPYAVDLIGYPKNQIVGKQCFNFSASAENGRCPVTTLQKDINHTERKLRLANGEVIPILKTVKRAVINDRPVLVETFLDLRERKKAEEEQKEQLHFLSELMNNIPIPLYFKEKDGTYRLWNSAYAKFKGLTAEEVIGNTSFEIYPREMAEEIERRDLSLFKDPTNIQSYTIQLPDHEGNIRDLEVTKSVYFKRDGTIDGLIGVIIDKTDRNRMEAQLHQAQKLESIGQLAADIAHEINTPTQYVGDNTRFLEDAFKDIKSVLKSYTKLFETVKTNNEFQPLVKELEQVLEDADLEYLEEEIPVAIEQSLEGVERVSKIVRSMKEFSHPGTEEKTPINLNKAIESTITVARNEWKYVADIKTDFDDSMGPVSCYPGELNQVFLNMIVNAAHAMEKRANGNTEKGTINISTRANGNAVKIEIRDNGAGIPADIRHRIFDPFFTTKEVGKGTGQGLSIAHTVITENHMGTITCESEAGHGTTFTIQLPLNSSPSTEVPV